MEYKHIDQRKGVAGLSVLLSVIAMLFMIGLIVMVFVIAGAKMSASLTTTVNDRINNETINVSDASYTATNFAYDDVSCSIIKVSLTNWTEYITAGNWSAGTTGCSLSFISAATGDQSFNGTNWNVTYDSARYVDDAARKTINATYQSLDDVIDWFPTFIVLTAMVVLILLVVIIINSIKGSGLTGEGA